MVSAMPQIRLILDDAIDATLTAHAKRKRVSKRSAATALLVKALSADVGVALDYTPPERGGWQGNDKSLENLVHYVDKLTDGGANDPTE